MEQLYELQSVSRVYRTGAGEVRAVNELDLSIRRGEMVAVEGPSGSGKTTLLQLLGALDAPTSGTITFAGRDLGSLRDRDRTQVRRDDIGFVFQHFNLIPTLTAAENVEAALVGERDAAHRSAQLLAQVGLARRAEHLPSRLSGGEQQRVAVARALARGPQVLLADEPTGNLDTTTASELMGLLSTLASDNAMTVIVVTHAQDVARQAQRRISLRDGRLVSDEASATVCTACGGDVFELRDYASCACGKRFSRKAVTDQWKSCPNCGGPRKTSRTARVCVACRTAR